ncbi:MAG TPA: ABC transporter ATP-binding protein [Planctomycetota bacterium]|nr:ABC transporter ATP-binding protein [Planctomycetota bacterium]
MIEVRDIKKIFYTHEGKEQLAVDGLSFRVERGEVYGLFGPNGAGKTTTLRILAGLMRPNAGDVLIDGVSGAPDPLVLKERAGFLTANTGLYARLTPRETLMYFARLRGVPESKLAAHIGVLVELLGLTPFADRRCEGMSTGERQRVQIARTLIGDPPVLILDEPTLGLDVLSNRLILSFIREAAGHGRTIILSTHHLDEVETVCTRYGLMHRGKMLAEGDLAHLRTLTGKERLSEIFLALFERIESASSIESVDFKSGRLLS